MLGRRFSGIARRCTTSAGLFAVLLAGCTAADRPTTDTATVPTRGGTLVVGLKGQVDAWNPYTTGDLASASLLDLIYPRLVVEGAEPGTFEPWLAERWAFSEDRRRLTFFLRRDARWTDGAGVTCADVRFTHTAQTAEALAWPGAFLKQRIERIECPDPHTAVFRFTESYPDQLIDANDDAIVPQAYADVPFEAWSGTVWEDRAVTCGPFRIADVRAGQEAVLERDGDWWDAATTWLDRVILRAYPEATGAFDRLLDGSVDLLVKVPPDRAGQVAAHPQLVLYDLPSLSYTFLAWNQLAPEAYLEDRRRRGCAAQGGCDRPEDLDRLRRERPHPILADRRVRRALDLALDREDIKAGVWAGHARSGSSPIVSAQWAHDAAVPPTTFDPAAGSRLLAAAGWARGPDGLRYRGERRLELRAIVQAEHAVRRDVLDRIVANLSAVGVTLVPEPLPRREFVARARDKAFDVLLIGWSAGTRVQPDSLLHARAALDRGNNLASWSTPASDDLLDRATAATSRQAARPLWHAWQAMFAEELPLSVLYEERLLVARSARVHGPAPAPLNPYLALGHWWIPAAAGGD